MRLKIDIAFTNDANMLVRAYTLAQSSEYVYGMGVSFVEMNEHGYSTGRYVSRPVYLNAEQPEEDILASLMEHIEIENKYIMEQYRNGNLDDKMSNTDAIIKQLGEMMLED